MKALEEQQKKVVEADSKNILCVAGPGSGKTYTLVERVAYLVEHKKVSCSEIAMFTFTRKAAQEMRERIEKRIGEQQARQITMERSMVWPCVYSTGSETLLVTKLRTSPYMESLKKTIF